MRRSRMLVLAACAALLLLTLTSTITGPSRAVAAPEGCMENPFGNTALYMRGGFNGWGATSDYQFTYNCDHFELQAEFSGPSEFKVADANWSASTDFGGGAGGNRPVEGEPLQLALQGSNLNFDFDGVYRVILDVSQSTTEPTLTIFQCQANPFDEAVLGLSGTFNGWTPASDQYFLYDCDGYYLNVNIEGTHEFKIGDPLGTPDENFGAADSENNQVVLDQPFPLVSDAEAGGSAANLEFTFTGEHTLRLGFDENGQLTLTISAQTWVNPGIPQPITDPVARQVRFDSQSSGFKQPYGAVPAPATVDFALEAPLGVDAATLVVETRRLEGNQEILEYLNPVRVPMSRTQDGEMDRWEASYQFDDVNVYGYYFELTIGGEQYVYQNNDAIIYWTLERGSGGLGEIDFLPDDTESIRRYRQTVYSPDFEVPEYAPDIVYYYIFPERFRNGEPANDPQPGQDTYLDGPIEVHENWIDTPYVPGEADGSATDDNQYNNDFFGGDLAGIIEKLDYLQELGINTLYINPIFEAGSNHKYDTADYLNVDDNFGTNEDFALLTAEAEARGIRVILDTSLNHTGSDSVYFDRYANFPGTGAFEGETIQPDSPWADWYTFYPDETNPDDQYQGWLGITTLPELTESDSWKDFAFRASDSVMNTWLDLGADGWRMDVAPWVSDPFWREWRTSIREHRPDALLVAETWFDSSKYFLGDTFDSTMNYIFRNAVYEFADGANADEQYQNIELMREAYPPQAFYALMNLLSTHDAERALYHFGYTDESNSPEQIAEAKQRFRLAVLFQMTFPGAPTIFYGDEVGLTGGADPFNRAPYPWADEGGQPDNALLEDFKTLIALRNDNAVLRRGSIDEPLYSDEHVIALLRTYGEESAITAFNNYTETTAITVELPAGASANAYTDALTGEVFTPKNGMLSLTVPALYGRVLFAGQEPADSVAIVGSFQSELGCADDWQPACSVTELTLDANDDVWQGSWEIPAGDWEYKAALNDSWDENYGLNATPDGSNIPLAVTDTTSVKFYYDHKTHWVTDNQNSVIAVAPGNFQSELGCANDWDPSCLRSWLQDPDGDGIYAFSTTALPAGDYEAKVAIDESWTENYGQGGVFDGPNIPFTVPAPGTLVSFEYDPVSHVLTIRVGEEPTAISLALTGSAAAGGSWLPLALAGSTLMFALGAMTWRRQRSRSGVIRS